MVTGSTKGCQGWCLHIGIHHIFHIIHLVVKDALTLEDKAASHSDICDLIKAGRCKCEGKQAAVREAGLCGCPSALLHARCQQKVELHLCPAGKIGGEAADPL